MKIFAFFPVLLVAFSLSAQAPHKEFQSDSEFMYDQYTMDRLSVIVDSLNLQFLSCDLNRDYHSVPQAMGHFFTASGDDAARAKASIERGVAFEEFEKEFASVIERDHLIIQHHFTNYRGEAAVEFRSVAIESWYPHRITSTALGRHPAAVKGKWLYDHMAANEYSKESISGFYFTSDFAQTQLPEPYARHIQYSDCMVDTNQQIFRANAQRESYAESAPPAVKSFIHYVNKTTNRPARVSYNRKKAYDRYREKFDEWDSTHFVVIEKELLNQSAFKQKLEKAASVALDSGYSSPELEEYVGRYLSKEAELELKRSRIVVGRCSMDSRPREHAKDIAALSAEVANWEVFLRSHLNIMNDYFSRVSDGSYAWEGRKTYIGELEALDINTLELLIGISLRFEDAHPNHYFGDVGRIGRALAESKDPEQVVAALSAMMADKTLDDYNRLIAYYLLVSRANNLSDDAAKESAYAQVKEAVKGLPEHFQRRIAFDDE